MVRILLSIGLIQVVVMAVGLVRAKAFAMLLGPAGVGVISTIDQWILTIVSLSALSLPFTAMKFMARDYSRGVEAFRRSFSQFFRTLLVLSGTSLLVSLALLAWQPSIFGAELTPYRLSMALALMMVPAFILNIFFVNTLAAAERARASAVLQLIFTAVVAAGAIAGCVAGGIGALYAASTITGAAVSAGSAYFIVKRLGIGSLKPSGSLVAELKANPEIASYSLLLYTAMAAYSVMLLVSRYAVFSELGAAAAGFLQAQMSTAMTVGAVIAPMSNLYLAPLVNRDAAIAAKALAAHEFASKAAIFLLLGAMPFVLFPQAALTMLFSSQFALAGKLLFLFLLWQCVYQVANVYLQLLVGLDDVVFFTVATCAAYLAGMLALPVLLRSAGAAGVGIALVLTVAAAGMAATIRLAIKFHVQVPPRVWSRFALMVCGVVGAAGLGWAGPEFTVLGFVARASYLLIVCGLIVVGLTSEEKRVMVIPARFLARL